MTSESGMHSVGVGPSGPLAGLRVLDCSTVLAGPYCTMVLADLGADVVKVEPPEGDGTRTWGPPWVGEGPARVAAYYLAVNRNKRSISLDLRQPDGAAILARLLARSDVFVENFRAGGLVRLGFGDARLAELNPRLVHLAISGYGTSGPDAGRPGYDSIAQAIGGLMSITGAPDAEGGRPTKVGVALTDIVTGLFGAVGVLAALTGAGLEERRAVPGDVAIPKDVGDAAPMSGERVDVSLFESTLAVLINQAQNAFATGRSPGRRGNAHPNIVPYETFDAADRPIAVAVGSDRQWSRFCLALGLPALADDPRFATNAARVEAHGELRETLAERFAERPASEWLAVLEAAEIPSGPINDVLGALESPQAAAREMAVTLVHPTLGPVRQVGLPIKLTRHPGSVRSAPPLLGEHTAEVLGELGYDRPAIRRLARNRVT